MREVSPNLSTKRPADAVAQPVYLVYIRIHPQTPDGPNVELVGAKLNRKLADQFARKIPGAWVEKVMADKSSTSNVGGAAMQHERILRRVRSVPSAQLVATQGAENGENQSIKSD